MTRHKSASGSSIRPAVGLNDSASVPLPDDAAGVPEFVWRYQDRGQGRYVTQTLPGDLMNVLQQVAIQAVDPLTTLGGSPVPKTFGSVDALLSFLVDHVIRNDDRGNRRNTRFAPDTRRSYSFRLPSELKHFFEIQRPVAINPYTEVPFANVSQMIVFCLHVFIMAAPWKVDPERSLWLENCAVSKPVAKKAGDGAGPTDTDQSNARREFARIEGMAQLQVRIDSRHYEALSEAIRTLAPDLLKKFGYRLTMSGLWISAATWASKRIDWSANPLVIQGLGESLPINWRDNAPQGLLVGT